MKPGSTPRVLIVSFFLITAILCLFPACSGSKQSNTSTVALDLDSLNRHLEHEDSVKSNLFFYQEAYVDYHKRFPAVMKSDYMRIAKGKDQDFCLFRPNPASTCSETGDKLNDVGMKESALEAYHAGLLSEGSNESSLNVRLWASVGQLSVENKDYAAGKSYFAKVLEVEPKNKWAKKQLASIPKD